MPRDERTAALIVTAGSRRCAIPLAYVVETMRPVPTEPVGGAPPFVHGLAVIRGAPTLVIDLRGLLNETASTQTAGRYVTLKVGDRTLALGVESVSGVRYLEPSETASLPPLLSAAGSDAIEAIGTHDAELLVVLRAARLAQDDLWPDAPRQVAEWPEAIEHDQLDVFRTLITRRFGLNCDDGRLDHLADVLRRRTAASGCSDATQYLELLARTASPQELRALAEQLTVGETFFFRNPDHFRAFTDLVLPARMRAHGQSRRLRLLSAGCASGEEPYSLAALLRDRLPEHEGWDIRITGLDLNPASLAKAAAGRYSPWALRATADEARERYFKKDGRELILNPQIRKMVTFEERNLSIDDPAYWRSLECDVVFCRNVLMYFTPEVMGAVVRRLTQALVPGGYLFLGHAETLRGLTQGFQLCHTHDTFYYRRREGSDPPLPAGAEEPAVFSAADIPAPIIEPSTTWYEVIQQASARVTSLTEGGGRPPAPASVPTAIPDRKPAAPRGSDLSAVHELMKRERFVEALALLGGLAPDALVDPDVLLLRASLLTNGGRIAESEEVCRQLLALDDLNAGAHYLMALCREQAADTAGAMEHDEAAAHLDPGFAMPHLHLGLLARRLGDTQAARRELGLAQVLLVREDGPRVLLFGGGFAREALMALCRSELLALGEGR